jgi:hypothetical protein
MATTTLITTNTKVKTPIGVGTVYGHTKESPLTCLVRVTITDENRARLTDRNCWTPKATHLALFEFEEKELTIAK